MSRKAESGNRGFASQQWEGRGRPGLHSEFRQGYIKKKNSPKLLLLSNNSRWYKGQEEVCIQDVSLHFTKKSAVKRESLNLELNYLMDK